MQRQAEKEKPRSKKDMRHRKQSKMVDVNPTISIIILDVSGLNNPIKRQIFRLDKKTRSNYVLSTGDML